MISFLKLTSTRLVLDLILSILVVPAAGLLWLYRRFGSARLPRTTRVLRSIGVFPIRDHYYEPLFNSRNLYKPLDSVRFLPGLELNIECQLDLLRQFKHTDELTELKLDTARYANLEFAVDNGSFEGGDADFLYQFLRYTKPMKFIEVGSGASTKIARLALSKNDLELNRTTQHLCIEPFEQPWLNDFKGVEVIRQRLEHCDLRIFETLNAGDFLFIDSSHMIRPQGDVLCEYLEIIPILKPGVNVHVHDIFTPRDYPTQWLVNDVRFWNEQYLLEALLGNSSKYEIVAALNFLKCGFFNELSAVCPYLTVGSQPGSFYFRTKGSV